MKEVREVILDWKMSAYNNNKNIDVVTVSET